ncbi:hypothetical protein MUP32_03135 [Candidatus Microgenomates bacterium]|nr:hypothetical protein [Candidatus Microgenomates bacterium]
MLKQILVDSINLPVKYHNKIKFLIFECNHCHKHFKKQESYYRKQLKRRKIACCFCSPKCRSRYFFAQKDKPVSGWFQKLFHNW